MLHCFPLAPSGAIESGSRQLDLVESDNDDIVDDPSYGTIFVYGNVLVEPDGAGNSQIVRQRSGDFQRLSSGQGTTSSPKLCEVSDHLRDHRSATDGRDVERAPVEAALLQQGDPPTPIALEGAEPVAGIVFQAG